MRPISSANEPARGGASGNPEIVRLLLQHGASVMRQRTCRLPGTRQPTTNIIRNGPPSNSGVTALHNAAAFGPVGVGALPVKGRRERQCSGRPGLVPLSFALATENPSLAIVRTLIRAGADVNAPDSFGDTPLDWAEKFGYPQIIAELKQAGAKSGRTYEAPRLPVRRRPSRRSRSRGPRRCWRPLLPASSRQAAVSAAITRTWLSVRKPRRKQRGSRSTRQP